MNKLDVDYFIEKFKAIPENQWTESELVNGQTGACCALGHCNVRNNPEINDWVETEESKALAELFNPYTSDRFSTVYEINDNVGGSYRPEFLELTPKQRILKRLNEIKENKNV